MEIFVFGSNLAGRHGKGAALMAMRKYGAKYGVGEGRMGSSYALPTKGHNLETLSLQQIEFRSVHNFLAYSRNHSELKFRLTPIGCGLAGYKPEQIAPMFRNAPSNVILPPEFLAVLTPSAKS